MIVKDRARREACVIEVRSPNKRVIVEALHEESGKLASRLLPQPRTISPTLQASAAHQLQDAGHH